MMTEQAVRVDKEKRTLRVMIEIYCRKKHYTEYLLCVECTSLLEYACKRIDNCKFSNFRITCRKCGVHCYKPDMRVRIIEIMRFAGPRMVYSHPILAFKHIIKEMNFYI